MHRFMDEFLSECHRVLKRRGALLIFMSVIKVETIINLYDHHAEVETEPDAGAEGEVAQEGGGAELAAGAVGIVLEQQKELFGIPISQFIKGSAQIVYGHRIGHGAN